MEFYTENEIIIDAENRETSSDSLQKSNFTEKEASQFVPILGKFIKSYNNKDENLSNREWLQIELKNEIPNLSDEDATRASNEILNDIETFDCNISSLNNACDSGKSKEEWFANTMTESSSSMSVYQYGEYLKNIDEVLKQCNADMLETVLTKESKINMNPQLNGFIAEQHHANSFNMKAALANSKFRAEVLKPKPGQTYGKNSVDLVIKDGSQIVHRYQAKLSADAVHTIKNFKKIGSNYNNQQLLTGKLSKSEFQKVKGAFSNQRSVTDKIGGTDRVNIESSAISKKEAQRLQYDLQQKGRMPARYTWNSYSTRELAFNLGKEAALCGVQVAIITTGFGLAAKTISGQKIDKYQVVEKALVSGTDVGVKAATAGALKVGVEKGVIKFLPKASPYAAIACVAVENTKVLLQLGQGKISPLRAVEQMGRTSVSICAGLAVMGKGAVTALGAATFVASGIGLGTIAGPVGIIVGFIGGTIGYMAGSTAGNLLYTGVGKFVNTAKSFVKSAWSSVRSVGKSICNSIKNFL